MYFITTSQMFFEIYFKIRGARHRLNHVLKSEVHVGQSTLQARVFIYTSAGYVIHSAFLLMLRRMTNHQTASA